MCGGRGVLHISGCWNRPPRSPPPIPGLLHRHISMILISGVLIPSPHFIPGVPPASWGTGSQGVWLFFSTHHHHHGARERDLIFPRESHSISVHLSSAGLGKGGRKRGVLGREASTIGFPQYILPCNSHAYSTHLCGVKYAGASRSRRNVLMGIHFLGKKSCKCPNFLIGTPQIPFPLSHRTRGILF